MKKSLILIALAMVAALSVVSCKNNNKSKEPTQEEIQEQKQALADTVLAKIDDLAAKYQEASDKGDFSLNLVLSEEEKLVKPDYLLDPSLASTFVTKDQKITALGYYLTDYLVRIAYDMPLDESKDAIVKLAAEVDYPVDIDKMFADITIPISDIVKQEYNAYKERNDLASFWKFEYGGLVEVEYLFTKNPELYLNKITETVNAGSVEQWDYFVQTVTLLSEYDDELKAIADLFDTVYADMTPETIAESFSNIETSIATYKSDKYRFIEKRNALLQ